MDTRNAVAEAIEKTVEPHRVTWVDVAALAGALAFIVGLQLWF